MSGDAEASVVGRASLPTAPTGALHALVSPAAQHVHVLVPVLDLAAYEYVYRFAVYVYGKIVGIAHPTGTR
jgi:hypothetical protein